ncbi:hypothetical protein WAI453_001342 [Rhynchosporium graminicola]
MDQSEIPMTATERLIKRSLSCTLDLTFPRRKSNQIPNTTPAFVFDIDGVLFDKRRRLPGASRSLKYLQEKKIPFVFLTNRWIETDVEGAALMQDYFGTSGISPMQYISAQSPFANLVPRFGKQLVLIVGSCAIRAKFLADFYGFENCITPDEIYAANPSRYAGFVAPDRKAERARRIMIKAILVFDQPRKPHHDKMLIADLLLSVNGLVGSSSPKNGNRRYPNKGYQQDEQPEIWYTLAMPFVRTMSEHWQKLTGMKIENTVILGKPSYENFSIAETQLLDTHRQLHGEDASTIDTIWMIGDDIDTDILGAKHQNINSMLCTWKSVLVTTGVYKNGMLNGRPMLYWPSFFSTGVWEAVQLALRQGYNHKWWQQAGGDWEEISGTSQNM